MEINDIRNNLELLPDLIEEKEFKFLEKKYHLDYLSDMKKHILAKLMCEFKGSNPERERQALASDEYRLHLDGMFELTRTLSKMASEFHALQNKFESMRSLNKNV